MRMTRIQMEIPEDILVSLNESAQDFENEMRVTIAMEHLRRGRLSLGKAAELAGLTKIEFFFELGKHGIPMIDYDEDDFLDELDQIRSR